MYLTHASREDINGIDLQQWTFAIEVLCNIHSIIIHLDPYVDISNSTLAIYSSLASSCDIPFFPFHASHLAFPLKSKRDPGLAVSRKNKNTAKDEFENIWKLCTIYFVPANAPILQYCTVSWNAIFQFLSRCYDRLCSEVCDGHWVGQLVGFLHHHYHCTRPPGCTVSNRQ